LLENEKIGLYLDLVSRRGQLPANYQEDREMDIQADFEYQIAVNMTDALLAAGLITPEEHAAIIQKHIEVFKPTLAALMA
jgi:hypothetical protein